MHKCIMNNVLDQTKSKSITTTKQTSKQNNPCQSRDLSPGTLTPQSGAFARHHRENSTDYSQAI